MQNAQRIKDATPVAVIKKSYFNLNGTAKNVVIKLKPSKRKTSKEIIDEETSILTSKLEKEK